MSLLVWYPLQGNTINYGRLGAELNPTVSGISYTNGKLGKCLSRGSLSWTAEQTAKAYHKTTSIAFWLKPISGSGTPTIIGNAGMGAETGRRKYTFYQWDSWNILHYTWQHDDSGSAFFGGTITLDGNWHHVVGIQDEASGTCSIYIDGVRRVHESHDIKNMNFNYAWPTTVIQDTALNNICDFRVYDHALSKKEIKELSRGLMAHYTFEDMTHNCLIFNGNQYIDTGIKGAARWEFDIQWTLNGTRQLMGYAGSSSEYWGVQVSGQYGQFDGSGVYGGNRDYVVSDGETRQLIVNGRVIGGFAGGTDLTNLSYKIGGLGPGSYACSFKLFNCKRYVGGLLTHNFVPHYKNGVMGLVDSITGTFYPSTLSPAEGIAGDYTKVVDSSGFGYGLTNTGVTYNNLNQTEVYFNNGSQVLTSYIHPTHTMDAITTSVWFKSSNTTPKDDYHIVLSIDAGCVEISIPKNGQFRFGGYTSGSTRVCENVTAKKSDGSTFSLLDGKWHLLNTVYDGTGWTGYVDGVYQTKWNASGTISRNDGGIIRIGKYTSAATYGATQASIADVRIYATALSENDIKELYNVRWAANKSSQVFTNVINEGQEKFQTTRSGTMNCNIAYESGNIPSDYLALDGIKMERVPWINTGVVINNANTQIIVAADVTPTATSGNNCLAGCGNGSWTGPVMMNFCNGKLEFGTNGYNTSSEPQGAFAANERLVVHAIIDYSSQQWFKNGVQIKNITSRTCPTTTAPLYIGTFKTPSSSVGNSESFRGYIHYFEVKYGSIHKKFIPCKRLSDSVLGMYEINEGKFYSPEGGAYTAGKPTVSLGRDGALYGAEFNEI